MLENKEAKSEKKLSPFLMSLMGSAYVAVVTVVALTAIIMYESAYLKEFPISDSIGDCRIVNIVEAVENKRPLRIYGYENKTYNHIITTSTDGKIIDKSRGAIFDKKPLSEYEENKENTPYLMYDGEKIVKEPLKTMVLLGYINTFKFYYKLFHS